MKNVYVVEIPDLQQVLSQEDIAVWELFLLTEEKRYEKIRFQVSNDGECYTFQNVETFHGILATVQIDFAHNQILFHQGTADEKEFENFLLDILCRLFVRVEKNRIQFLSSTRNQRMKGTSKRK